MPYLNWVGKEKIVNHHKDVPYCVLERKYSFDSEGEHAEDNGSENMIIHGDNLLALKSLIIKYDSKIKCIYIDPPYNTGEEKWIYNDNVNDPQIKKWLGEVVGKEGEDMTRHDKWLCMMYPRLVLLRHLLSDDGAIFISIDDNELYNLKMICDEIFGHDNFICNFIWEKRLNRENRKEVSSRHDYVLCYAKNSFGKDRTLKLLEMSGEALDRYQNPDNDPRGPWKSDPATAQAGHATLSQFYTLVAPNGNTFNPPKGRCWLYTESVMKQKIADNRIWFGVDGNNTPRKKTYLYDKERGLTPESILFAQDVSTNEKAKNELKLIFPEEIPFPTPKPRELIKHIISLISDKQSIILDSFAGSGTTAHSVLDMNFLDEGERKFILVEMSDYANSITAERVKRVIEGYEEIPGLNGSFSYYELGQSIVKNGFINECVDLELIRQYIFYSETKSSLSYVKNKSEFYLGKFNDCAYYFYYKRGQETILNEDTFSLLKEDSDWHVVYADVCILSKEQLQCMRITFKKIPRDIIQV